MAQPKITLGLVSNIWSRQMHFEKSGDIEPGHSHKFDHLTLLTNGKLQVDVDGKKTIFTSPHMIYISKSKMHELTALEDNTIAFCIHALREYGGNGDIIDPSMVPDGVTPENPGCAFADRFNPDNDRVIIDVQSLIAP